MRKKKKAKIEQTCQIRKKRKRIGNLNNWKLKSIHQQKGKGKDDAENQQLY